MKWLVKFLTLLLKWLEKDDPKLPVPTTIVTVSTTVIPLEE